MRNLKRVSVIVERGKLVGVFIPPEAPSDAAAPRAQIVVEKPQVIRDIQVEVPAVMKHSKDVDAFHAAIRRKLKLKK